MYFKFKDMPFNKTLAKKVAIWIGGIVAFLIILSVGLGIYFKSKWKPTLTEKIKQGVKDGSKGLYNISFKDISIDALTGNAVVDSIELTPDTAVFNDLKAKGQAPTHIFRVRLAHLKISRASLMSAYLYRKIRLNSIVLDNPSIDMIYYNVKRKNQPKEEKSLYEMISKTIKSIRINAIRLVDADFDYYNGTKKLQSVKHLTFNVKDFLLDSLSQNDTTRVLFSKDANFELVGYESTTKDKMYKLKLDTLQGSLTKKTLEVKGFKMIPVYPELEFSRKYSTQKDRYDLSFAKISFSGIDFMGLNNDGKLHAKQLKIGPAKVGVFMNRELPPPNFDKGKNYPHLALRRAPIPLLIDTLSLNNVDIAYTEYEPKSKSKGTVHLKKLSGAVLNLTNDSTRLITKNHALANLTTMVMGAGKLNVKIDFNLTAKDAAFSYVGHVDAFDMRALNSLSKPLGQVEIETGNLTSADFNVTANINSARGTVKFAYNNLKVQMLNKDGSEIKKKGFLSFLANKLLVRDANPSKGEAVRVASVTNQRVPQASFFNLMWKTVFIGIRENAGLGVVPMKKMAEPKKKK